MGRRPLIALLVVADRTINAESPTTNDNLKAIALHRWQRVVEPARAASVAASTDVRLPGRALPTRCPRPGRSWTPSLSGRRAGRAVPCASAAVRRWLPGPLPLLPGVAGQMWPTFRGRPSPAAISVPGL